MLLWLVIILIDIEKSIELLTQFSYLLRKNLEISHVSYFDKIIDDARSFEVIRYNII